MPEKIWKTIKIGLIGSSYGSRANFIIHLTDDGYCDAGNCRSISNTLFEVIERIPLCNTPQRVNLARKSIKQLELKKKKPTYDEICRAAKKKFGLVKCLPDVGLELAYQYPEQPRGEAVLVASEPIMLPGDDDTKQIISLYHGQPTRNLNPNGKMAITVFPDYDYKKWDEDLEFVFTIPDAVAK